MTKKLLLLLPALMAAIAVLAGTYRVEDIPMVHLQDGRRYVSNPDRILSPAAVAGMDSALHRLEQTTGIQVLAVAVEDIEGGDCFEFAYQLGERNGVGEEGRDNGLVILLVTGERCVQFATGYGLEASLPDAICKRIQERYMLEAFARNDWDRGMAGGIQAVCRHLENAMKPGKKADGSQEWPLLLTAFFIIALIAILSKFGKRRCPACRKRKLRQVNRRTVSRRDGVKTEEITYLCSHCGHTFTERRQSHDENFRGGGPFIGGGFFGGSIGGGGGFSGGGGSFGGGDFGGGGAGSRF